MKIRATDDIERKLMSYLKPESYVDPESRDRSHTAGPWARKSALRKGPDLVRLVKGQSNKSET
jgi:hypothetical protein